MMSWDPEWIQTNTQTSEIHTFLPPQNTASPMGLQQCPPFLSTHNTVWTVSEFGDAGVLGKEDGPRSAPLGFGLKCFLIIIRTLALILDSRQRGHLCNSLFSRLVAWSQGLSVRSFSGTGPDQYCILSDCSQPSGEDTHPTAAPCTLLEQINTPTVPSFVPSPALRCSACSTRLLKGLRSLPPGDNTAPSLAGRNTITVIDLK